MYQACNKLLNVIILSVVLVKNNIFLKILYLHYKKTITRGYQDN